MDLAIRLQKIYLNDYSVVDIPDETQARCDDIDEHNSDEHDDDDSGDDNDGCVGKSCIHQITRIFKAYEIHDCRKVVPRRFNEHQKTNFLHDLLAVSSFFVFFL